MAREPERSKSVGQGAGKGDLNWARRDPDTYRHLPPRGVPDRKVGAARDARGGPRATNHPKGRFALLVHGCGRTLRPGPVTRPPLHPASRHERVCIAGPRWLSFRPTCGVRVGPVVGSRPKHPASERARQGKLPAKPMDLLFRRQDASGACLFFGAQRRPCSTRGFGDANADSSELPGPYVARRGRLQRRHAPWCNIRPGSGRDAASYFGFLAAGFRGSQRHGQGRQAS